MLSPEGRKDLYKVLYECMLMEVMDTLSVIYDAGIFVKFCCQKELLTLSPHPSHTTMSRTAKVCDKK